MRVEAKLREHFEGVNEGNFAGDYKKQQMPDCRSAFGLVRVAAHVFTTRENVTLHGALDILFGGA